MKAHCWYKNKEVKVTKKLRMMRMACYLWQEVKKQMKLEVHG